MASPLSKSKYYQRAGLATILGTGAIYAGHRMIQANEVKKRNAHVNITGQTNLDIDGVENELRKNNKYLQDLLIMKQREQKIIKVGDILIQKFIENKKENFDQKNLIKL